MTNSCSSTTCDKVKERYKWTRSEKDGFKALAKWCLSNWPCLHRAFVDMSKPLAAAGEAAGYDWNQLVTFERSLAAVCCEGNLLKAAVMMADQLVFGVEKYLGGSSDPNYHQVVTQLSDFRSRLIAEERR